jgi:uncharacterized protein (TIGR00288 family)
VQIVKNVYDARARHESLSGRPIVAQNAALLIDFDNVTMGIRSDLQNQLRKLLNSEIIKGKVSVQRAYADWRRYPQYIAPLSESSIDLIFAPAFGSNKKNATDIRLAIDALELVFTRPEIGVFILLSGDSDFSSLVLKLKEYGKYVIGVGIRESASDLLIQNCDEYYSYSELTGLAKETEADVLPRDPWELVVEAVVQMQKDNDVMRSDRLKQVMQEIDPHFTEKDAGFNKFSKFVAEAGRRGLLTLERMEYGQFEVRPGPDANVPVAEAKSDSGTVAPAGDRAKRGPTADRAVPAAGLTLAEAFALLKSTLRSLGAEGGEASGSEEVRLRMIETSGRKSDPMLDGSRFRRVLRQAHDANIVDLVKDGDEYLVKLNASVVAEGAATEASDASVDDEADTGDEQPTPDKRKRSSAGGAKKKSSTKRASRKQKAATEVATADVPASEQKSSSTQSKGTLQTSTERPGTRPNPRYRAGSRKATRRRSDAPGDESAQPKSSRSQAVREEPAPSPPSAHRSVRPRSGSRRRQATGAKETKDEARPAVQSPSPPEPSPSATHAPPPAAERAPQSTPANDDDAPGLLKRMTTAFQRAVMGNDEEE